MTSVPARFGAANLIRNKATGPRDADPLPRLLDQLAARAGRQATIERSVSRPWASALFEGRRSLIQLRLSGEGVARRADLFAQGLGEAEWTLPGHFVADISIDARTDTDESVLFDLAALTIRDW